MTRSLIHLKYFVSGYGDNPYSRFLDFKKWKKKKRQKVISQSCQNKQMQFIALKMTTPSANAELPTTWMCFHLSRNKPNGRILITLWQNCIKNLWRAGCLSIWPVILGAFSLNSMYVERLLTWRLLVKSRNRSRIALITKFHHICLYIFLSRYYWYLYCLKSKTSPNGVTHSNMISSKVKEAIIPITTFWGAVRSVILSLYYSYFTFCLVLIR